MLFISDYQNLSSIYRNFSGIPYEQWLDKYITVHIAGNQAFSGVLVRIQRSTIVLVCNPSKKRKAETYHIAKSAVCTISAEI